MKQLRNLKIGARLRAGFGLTLLLLSLTGGLALFEAAQIYDGTQELALNHLPSVQMLGEASMSANGVRRASLRSVMESSAEGKLKQRNSHDASLTQFYAALEAYRSHASTNEEKLLFAEISQRWADYMMVDRQLLQLSEAGNSQFTAARALAVGDSATAFTNALDPIFKEVAVTRHAADAAVSDAANSYRIALRLTAALTLLALVLGAAIAAAISRSIVEPIRISVEIARTVARGDLTSNIQVSGRDEMSQLLLALGEMNRQLVDIVSQVRNSSESIAIGSAQIATGNNDLSRRTEEQAASLEETAASMEQLAAAVRQNTENALRGNRLTIDASETAIRGGSVVARVIETMRGISSSSEQMAQIISVIEGIAFQTNILALNAAVEAARAGEQGRGFAVVAGEVRSLAQRCAAAAKDIKELINTSVKRIATGASLVDEAGRTTDEIVAAVKRVNSLMTEITAASNEQNTGIEQVNQAVVQMDQVTQQNAALVEEASAAAQSVAQQAQDLRKAVAVFAIAGTGSFTSPVIDPQGNLRRSTPMIRKPQRAILTKSEGTPATTSDRDNIAATDTGVADWQTF